MFSIKNLKRAIWLANLFTAKSAKKTHWWFSGFLMIFNIVGGILALVNGHWVIALLFYIINTLTSLGVAPKMEAVTKQVHDDISSEGVNTNNGERSSWSALTSMSLANVAIWTLKALQLTVSIKLFMNASGALRRAVKEGASPEARASDFAKALLWFICIPLMFLYDMSTILKAFREPLQYIGLYDSVSRVMGSKPNDLEERKVAVQEEANRIARERLERESAVTVDAKFTEAVRNGKQANVLGIDELEKLGRLLSSTEPLVVKAAYRRLIRIDSPHASDEDVEVEVQRRMKGSSVYLTSIPAIVPGKNNNNNNRESPISVGDDVELQSGIVEKVKTAANYILSMPMLAFFIGLTIIMFFVTLVYVFKTRKQQKNVDRLVEAAAGTVVQVDNQNNEWWKMYQDDCLLLYGRTITPLPGSDFSDESKYLMSLAAVIGKYPTDPSRLTELCNYKSDEQIRELTELLPKYKQPKVEVSTDTSDRKESKVTRVDVSTDTSDLVKECATCAKHVAQKHPNEQVIVINGKPDEVSKIILQPIPGTEPKVSAFADYVLTEVKEAEAPKVAPESKVEPAPAPVTEAAKNYVCTCGKKFSSPKAKRNHRRRVGCPVAESSPAVKTDTESTEVKEGRVKGSKGSHMKKAALDRGEAPKEKMSKDKRMQKKLGELEQQRNEKYKKYKELENSKTWADQMLLEEIREELEEIKRKAKAYGLTPKQEQESSVWETFTSQLRLLESRQKVESLLRSVKGSVQEGCSSGGELPGIPNVWVRVSATVGDLEAFCQALPMANRLFVPLHWIRDDIAKIGGNRETKINVTCNSGKPLPDILVGEFKAVEGFDLAYAKYQVGGLSYIEVDRIGETKPGDKVVIKLADRNGKPVDDTCGDVIRIENDMGVNVKSKTTKGDCNALVWSTESRKLVGLHNTFWQSTKENGFILLSKVPRKYFGTQVLAGEKPAFEVDPELSEN